MKNENVFATTTTNYDEDCNVIHHIDYILEEDDIKLISILTHEIGHVITESKPCLYVDGVYPIVKRTTTFYTNCKYRDGDFLTTSINGYRMADGFLESICTKIFESSEFREELFDASYDLGDYVYKDKRLFPSRIYDEYKACFELFDYLMDGALFEFSCKAFETNEELIDFINRYNLNNIFSILDLSNDSLYELKVFEGKEMDSLFIEKLDNYVANKKNSLMVASIMAEDNNKIESSQYKRLLDNYTDILNSQVLLPIPDSYLDNKIIYTVTVNKI